MVAFHITSFIKVFRAIAYPSPLFAKEFDAIDYCHIKTSRI